MRNDESGAAAGVEEGFRRAAEMRPLGAGLDAMTDTFRRLKPEVAAAYDALARRLAAAGSGLAAPRPGDPMPEFALPDEDGRLVTLAGLLAEGPLVISFNRGHWCAYCRLETRALAQAEAALAERGARLVAIVPETARFARALRADSGLGGPVLTDMDAGYAASLGLAMWPGETVERLYRASGIDMAAYQGGAPLLPLPATFVVGRDGRVRAAFADPDFRRRMPVEAVLAALEG